MSSTKVCHIPTEFDNRANWPFIECIDSSRETLRKEATEALDEAYKGLLDDVAKVKLGNEKAVALVKAQVNAVMAPLSDEVVGITSPTGEKSEMKLFDQISAFKTLFQEEEEKLSVHWEAWESVQEQIAVLGQHVLGEKGVVAHVDVKDKVSQSDSYLSAIARLNKELKASLNGPVKEVENAGEEALRAIEEMEKVSLETLPVRELALANRSRISTRSSRCKRRR